MKTKYIKIGAWGETIKKDSPIGTLNLNKFVEELSDKTIKLFDTLNDFPNIGNSENLYLDSSTGELYKWYNNQYQSLNPTNTSSKVYYIYRNPDYSSGGYDEVPNAVNQEIPNPQEGDIAIISMLHESNISGTANNAVKMFSTWKYENSSWELLSIVDYNVYTKGINTTKLYIKAWLPTVLNTNFTPLITLMESYYTNINLIQINPFNNSNLNWEINDEINDLGYNPQGSLEAKVVDWVIIRFYSQKGGNPIFTKTGLLLADGRVVGMDGVSPIIVSDWVGTYYIGIKTRASLETITYNKFVFPTDRIELDFTTNEVAIIGDTSSPATLPYNSLVCKYHLIMGDLNDDKVIDSTDVAMVQARLGIGDDYENGAADLNLDGSIDSNDVSIVNNNVGISLYW